MNPRLNKKYQVSAKCMNGSDFHSSSVILRAYADIDFSEIESPILMTFEKEQTIFLNISNTEKYFQIVSLDKNDKSTSASIVKGHLNMIFHQLVFGKTILVIPFDNKKDHRILLDQVIKIS